MGVAAGLASGDPRFVLVKDSPMTASSCLPTVSGIPLQRRLTRVGEPLDMLDRNTRRAVLRVISVRKARDQPEIGEEQPERARQGHAAIGVMPAVSGLNPPKQRAI
jgi:hypothetical protein